MADWLVILASLLYLALLFIVARWGQRFAGDRPLFAHRFDRAGVYALTLAVHNTTWSFYGSVGRAATSAFANIPTYLGITLFLLLGQGLMRRVVVIAKARNITSVADFISLRYGKSRPIAAFVTVASLFAVLPYMALQFKAIGFSYQILTGGVAQGEAGFAQKLGAPDFWAAAVLALFTMVIGVRHIHASERHRGFVLALALESVVKIVAFLAVALFAIYSVSEGVTDIVAQAARDPQLAHLLSFDFSATSPYALATVAFLSFLCLPQSFHVAVVENDGAASVRPAAWLYVAYMALFAVLITPMALAGLRALGPSVNPDTFTIAIPVAAGQPALGLAAFIGGLSAATGMIMVTTVALSTMLCNDVVVPLMMRMGEGVRAAPISEKLLVIRRVLVAVVILLAFMMQRLIDARTPLMQMGVMSFVAGAQFAPAFLGGVVWRRANGYGAIAGMAIGLAVWFYALLLPSMASVFGLSDAFLRAGPFGMTTLSPYGLLGFGALDPISHAVFWSLLLNTASFVLISLATPLSEMAQENTLAFLEGGESEAGVSPRIERVADLASLAARFAGAPFVDAAFRRQFGGSADLHAPARDEDVAFTERLIAGVVGAGTARVVMAAALRGRVSTRSAANAMLDEAARALQFGHGLLQAITENVAQGICAFDANLNVVAWNRQFVTMLDLPAAFMKAGMPLRDIVEHNRTRGEYAEDDLARLFVNRAQAQTSWPYIYERRRPNGLVLEIAINRMTDGGFVATYTDVSERVRAARALQIANEQLEARVASRTQALEEAKLEAEKANASKTRFLAAASHDLLQPLSAARLFLAAVQEDARKVAADGDGAGLRDNADSAIAALQSTEHLLAELLYVSTLDARAVKVSIAAVALNNLFVQLQREFSPIAAERGLRLRIVPTAAAVSTDAALLRRVLQNYLSNALRYTRRGGVLLGCRRRENCVRIEVWDTGVGFAEDMRAVIFEEFRRLETPAHEQSAGLGLGLAIVDRIARLIDAPLDVRSTPERGSMFAIALPLSRDETVASPAQDDVGEFSTSPLSILCVDDQPAILDGMTALLTRWGHRVTVAANRRLALALCGAAKAPPPDVILIDYRLGGGEDGLAALAALRASSGRMIPAILITADRSDALRAAARNAACELLHKPVKPAVLRKMLNRMSARKDSVIGNDRNVEHA